MYTNNIAVYHSTGTKYVQKIIYWYFLSIHIGHTVDLVVTRSTSKGSRVLYRRGGPYKLYSVDSDL